MSLPRGYNEAGPEWLEPWCDEHPDGSGQGCVACIGASHDAWMHRAKAAEAEVERLRQAMAPFVDEAALGSYEWGKFVPADDDDECEVWVTVAQMKAARDALEAGRER